MAAGVPSGRLTRLPGLTSLHFSFLGFPINDPAQEARHWATFICSPSMPRLFYLGGTELWLSVKLWPHFPGFQGMNKGPKLWSGWMEPGRKDPSPECTVGIALKDEASSI